MPELPTSFGKYFLTEKLATGGMAEIYLAKIVGPGGFEKQLVIKQIHPKLSGQRHFVDLFVAEAKTLVTLAHGNIVPVYELGVVDETYFIAMEYIDGPTLYRLTESVARRDGRIQPAVAAWVTARILEGLDYAHRKGEGVIHRDLSPRNVMLSRDGEVKLVDFGIAVTLGSVGQDESAQSAPTGSFPYMSPEQVRREQLTAQTDLFSVGVLLWEMLVGHRLFARSDPDATLLAVTEAEIPRPSSVRPDIPAKLDDVVMRALERDKTRRWADAGEMLAALQKYLYALDDTPGPRDLTALVAKFCPPETRRLPTYADAEPAGDATTPRHDTEATPPPAAPAGPRTAVIPRDGERPRGKARAATRQESFATHVELKDILERGTPLFGVPAVGGDDAAHPGEPTTTVAAPAKTSEPSPDTTMKIRAHSVREGKPATIAPSRALLIIVGVGAIGLAIASVWMFLHGREAVLAPDAGPRLDAPFYLQPDAAVTASADAGVLLDGAVVVDAVAIAVIDAALVRDADVLPRDAGVRPRPDGGTVSIDARVSGTAKLVVGADPWGEIVIDGVKRGRTPQTIQVSAGKHVVEIIFPGVDPPKKETYTVDLADGSEKEFVPDFTKL
ncbi:MAG: serine/threonine protein kinase [Myxococcales bacterium]|nr:serine/threonine protein kinase [Myxococcales bacterium]